MHDMQALRTALLQHQTSIAAMRHSCLADDEDSADMAEVQLDTLPHSQQAQLSEAAWAGHIQNALQALQQKDPEALLPDMYICGGGDSVYATQKRPQA